MVQSVADEDFQSYTIKHVAHDIVQNAVNKYLQQYIVQNSNPTLSNR